MTVAITKAQVFSAKAMTDMRAATTSIELDQIEERINWNADELGLDSAERLNLLRRLDECRIEMDPSTAKLWKVIFEHHQSQDPELLAADLTYLDRVEHRLDCRVVNLIRETGEAFIADLLGEDGYAIYFDFFKRWKNHIAQTARLADTADEIRWVESANHDLLDMARKKAIHAAWAATENAEYSD